MKKYKNTTEFNLLKGLNYSRLLCPDVLADFIHKKAFPVKDSTLFKLDLSKRVIDKYISIPDTYVFTEAYATYTQKVRLDYTNSYVVFAFIFSNNSEEDYYFSFSKVFLLKSFDMNIRIKVTRLL